MKISTKINEILSEFLGVKIARVTRNGLAQQSKIEDIEKSENTPIKKMYFEFIGPPGVGKSTLFNDLNFSSNRWMTINTFKQNTQTPVNKFELESFKEYQLLARRKIERVLTMPNILDTDKMWYIQYFFNILMDDIQLSIDEENKVVISDEGLMHNFGKEILDNYQVNKDSIRDIFKNRGIVFCYASPKTIVERIINRNQQTGRLLPHHRRIEIDSLESMQIDAIEKNLDLLRVLELENIPFIKINTEENNSDNLQKIELFIKNSLHPRYK